jgi:hypothetical protein
MEGHQVVSRFREVIEEDGMVRDGKIGRTRCEANLTHNL